MVYRVTAQNYHKMLHLGTKCFQFFSLFSRWWGSEESQVQGPAKVSSPSPSMLPVWDKHHRLGVSEFPALFYHGGGAKTGWPRLQLKSLWMVWWRPRWRCGWKPSSSAERFCKAGRWEAGRGPSSGRSRRPCSGAGMSGRSRSRWDPRRQGTGCTPCLVPRAIRFCNLHMTNGIRAE